MLGDDFSGVLVTDCYSGYDAHTARAKQKCLAHLTRTARDWQKVVPQDSQAWQFFEDIKAWVRPEAATGIAPGQSILWQPPPSDL